MSFTGHRWPTREPDPHVAVHSLSIRSGSPDRPWPPQKNKKTHSRAGQATIPRLCSSGTPLASHTATSGTLFVEAWVQDAIILRHRHIEPAPPTRALCWLVGMIVLFTIAMFGSQTWYTWPRTGRSCRQAVWNVRLEMTPPLMCGSSITASVTLSRRVTSRTATTSSAKTMV